MKNLTEKEKLALEELVDGLRGLYGDNLSRVILYGSKARGDATEDSDIDILVVLKKYESWSDLYSVNTCDVVFMAFLCGYFLIMWFGVRGILYIASVTSLMIGIIVLLFSRSFRMFLSPVLINNNCSDNERKNYYCSEKYCKPSHFSLPPSNINPIKTDTITTAIPRMNFSAATICAKTNPAYVYFAKSYRIVAKLLRCFLFSCIVGVLHLIDYAVLLLWSFRMFLSPVRIKSNNSQNYQNQCSTDKKYKQSDFFLAHFCSCVSTDNFAKLERFINYILQKIKTIVNCEKTILHTDGTGFSNHLITKSPNHMILVVIGLSGFTALAYEVLWTRTLTMILGSSSYAFATMLYSFLVGNCLRQHDLCEIKCSASLQKREPTLKGRLRKFSNEKII